jgi:hypothetical protein
MDCHVQPYLGKLLALFTILFVQENWSSHCFFFFTGMKSGVVVVFFIITSLTMMHSFS